MLSLEFLVGLVAVFMILYFMFLRKLANILLILILIVFVIVIALTYFRIWPF